MSGERKSNSFESPLEVARDNPDVLASDLLYTAEEYACAAKNKTDAEAERVSKTARETGFVQGLVRLRCTGVHTIDGRPAEPMYIYFSESPARVSFQGRWLADKAVSARLVTFSAGGKFEFSVDRHSGALKVASYAGDVVVRGDCVLEPTKSKF